MFLYVTFVPLGLQDSYFIPGHEEAMEVESVIKRFMIERGIADGVVERVWRQAEFKEVFRGADFEADFRIRSKLLREG